MTISVDAEFENLCPPLSKKEFAQLEKNILDEGECHDPICLWNGLIVDGHNRWRIIQKHPDIQYETREMVFLTRNDAILWIINNQLGRRNLNKADAIMLAQKRGEIIAAEAKAKQSAAGGDRRSETYRENASVQMDKSASAPIDTRKEVAKLAGVSTGTVARFEEVQKKAPELIPKIQAQEMTIGGAYKAVKAKEQAAETPDPAPTPNPPKPVEPPKFTVNDLAKQIETNADTFIGILRKTLAEHNTLYAEADDRKKIYQAVHGISTRIAEIENLIK